MRAYLLDTNQLGQAVRRSTAVHSRIKREVARGIRVGTCIPVLCEIEIGAIYVNKADDYHAGLQNVLRSVRIWPLTLETSRHYGEISRDLKRRGRALSQVDIMLAALCRELDLTLVTTDKDFSALAWLKAEDWS
ncbi:MAG: type II toxin-antitoxin system VapC family toxin [Pirellulaceae bacterium]